MRLALGSFGCPKTRYCRNKPFIARPERSRMWTAPDRTFVLPRKVFEGYEENWVAGQRFLANNREYKKRGFQNPGTSSLGPELRHINKANINLSRLPPFDYCFPNPRFSPS